MKCFGCNREIEVGDRYIEDTASGFIGQDVNLEIDGVIGELFSGRADGKVTFCTDCTVDGGDYLAETFWGDEEQAA